jgi:hypothetical protein
LHIGLGKADAQLCQPVEIGRVQMRMPGATQVIEPELVVHDEQDIQFFLLLPELCPDHFWRKSN